MSDMELAVAIVILTFYAVQYVLSVLWWLLVAATVAYWVWRYVDRKTNYSKEDI